MAKHKKKRLLIVGAGGHGAVAADCAQLMNNWSEISFLDSKWPDYKKLHDWKVIGRDEDFINKMNKKDDIFIAIGNAEIRMKLIHNFRNSGHSLATIIHPTAIISEHVSILGGSLIAAGAIINIGTKIETGCIINTGATIDHDCVIGEGTHICPGVNLAGNVYVGKKTWLGISATAIHGIKIGANSIIGAGAVVVDDLPDNVTALGVPAKVITRENKKC